jgi:hypothetical protein
VLSEDMQYKRRKLLNFSALHLTDSQKKDYVLIEIEKLRRQAGKSMKDYPQIEMPSADQLADIGNKLMNKEMNYSKDEQRDEHQRIYSNLNEEQRNAFNAIINSVDNNLGKLIFIKGYGGIGKTYQWNAIMIKL